MTRQTRLSRQHVDLAREAGLGRLSLISVIAGLVTAYGTFAVLASIAGAVLTRIDVNTNFRTNDWTGSGAVAALATAIVLLLAYLFGGYVAGRMGRRAPLLHGIAVFVGSLFVSVVVSGLIAGLSDDRRLRGNLRSLGIPTTTDQITGVALTGVIVSVAAMLVGSVLGAMAGERWHTKLARRAADPSIGPAADLRRQAAIEEATRPARMHDDPMVAQDLEDARSAEDEAATETRPTIA